LGHRSDICRKPKRNSIRESSFGRRLFCYIFGVDSKLGFCVNFRHFASPKVFPDNTTGRASNSVSPCLQGIRNFEQREYCAYVIPVRFGPIGVASAIRLMNPQTYCELDESDRRFNGNRARTHLTTNLGMNLVTPVEMPAVASVFDEWISMHNASIQVHSTGSKFLIPPAWYR